MAFAHIMMWTWQSAPRHRYFFNVFGQRFGVYKLHRISSVFKYCLWLGDKFFSSMRMKYKPFAHSAWRTLRSIADVNNLQQDAATWKIEDVEVRLSSELRWKFCLAMGVISTMCVISQTLEKPPCQNKNVFHPKSYISKAHESCLHLVICVYTPCMKIPERALCSIIWSS